MKRRGKKLPKIKGNLEGGSRAVELKPWWRVFEEFKGVMGGILLDWS